MRCSELSLELGEELVGTAPHVERWQLFVNRGSWGRRAVEDAGVVAEEGAKPLLVRRAPAPEGRVFLVCTNRRRDECCTLRGAPVLRALGDRAVACTHLGGHRFAANVLVLPDNLLFGRLDRADALALADALEAESCRSSTCAGGARCRRSSKRRRFSCGANSDFAGSRTSSMSRGCGSARPAVSSRYRSRVSNSLRDLSRAAM